MHDSADDLEVLPDEESRPDDTTAPGEVQGGLHDRSHQRIAEPAEARTTRTRLPRDGSLLKRRRALSRDF